LNKKCFDGNNRIKYPWETDGSGGPRPQWNPREKEMYILEDLPEGQEKYLLPESQRQAADFLNRTLKDKWKKGWCLRKSIKDLFLEKKKNLKVGEKLDLESLPWERIDDVFGAVPVTVLVSSYMLNYMIVIASKGNGEREIGY
jgi:hypothetical protein